MKDSINIDNIEESINIIDNFYSNWQ